MRWDATISVLRAWQAYSVDLPWRSSVEQRSQADLLATRIAELGRLGELAVAGGNWHSYGRAGPVRAAALGTEPCHLRPSRMRYSHQDGSLTPNYDVHDVLASVELEDAAAVRAPELSDQGGPPSAEGQVNRICLTCALAGAVTRYVQLDMRGSERRALILTLDDAVAADSGR